LRGKCSRVKFLGSASLLGGGDRDRQQGEEKSKPVVCSLIGSILFRFFTTAPVKPSKQTQLFLDNMSKNNVEEKTRWD
jgi:hypothetical protein